MSKDLKEQIEARIREYLSVGDERFAWTHDAVRRFNFLPLYFGWVAILGVRPDTSPVYWDHEDDCANIHELEDPFLCRMALVTGAKKYPEIAGLVPQRPANAVTCEPCGGTGQLTGVPENAICLCGGLGWLIPGENRAPGTG